MSDFVNEGYELNWDSEIENEGSEFVIVDPGDYNFTVVNFERGRFQGSAKMPPCNQAKLTIRLDIPDGICDMKHNLFLHTKMEWKLCEFFTSIGQRQSGQRVAMNWNTVIGAKGKCRVTKRSFPSKDDPTKIRWANDIEKFYAPKESLPEGNTGYIPGKF